MNPVITAYDWIFPEGRGYVRDLRVRWALEEVRRAYDVRFIRWDERKDPANRARQPFGQVPTFEEEGLILFESGAIVLHIAQGSPGLLPVDPHARARAIAWMFAALNTVEPVFVERMIATAVEGDAPWTSARLPGVEARARGRLKDLADRLGDSEWLDGPFSAADLLMVAVLRDDLQLLEGFRTLAAYVARGEARPAFGRAMAAHLAGFTASAPADWDAR